MLTFIGITLISIALLAGVVCLGYLREPAENRPEIIGSSQRIAYILGGCFALFVIGVALTILHAFI